MNPLQKIIILLNLRPFTYLFEAIYALGLKRLLAALAGCPAVHSIYGCGSFFEGRCLFGLSDIDLIIIIDEKYTRADPESHDIVFAYNRVRRFFPFLGDWHEKAENLIFLSEIKDGFPVPESFRLRLKQERLSLLHGKSWLEKSLAGPVSINEAVSEIDTLLRMSLTKGEVHTSNQLFWKRIFSKLLVLVETLDLFKLAEEIRTDERLSFLGENDIPLFIRKSKPDDLFRLLLGLSRRIFEEVKKREEMTRVSFASSSNGQQPQVSEAQLRQKVESSKAVAAICQKVEANLGALRSPLFGIVPVLNYCPIDEQVVVVEPKRAGYGELRTISKTLAQDGEISESVLVRVDDFLFIMSRLPTHIDIVPLDPLIYANIYAQLLEDGRCFDMPAPLYEEQKAKAGAMLTALAGAYRKNEGWITKLPFPCLYLEDDLVVIQDAFHRMRVFLVLTDGVDPYGLDALVDILGKKHPGCREFLRDLLDYYRSLIGSGHQREFGNNLYRCLHQFMTQLLGDEPEISIDDHRKRLGITVGIITRNRATDLQDVLASLTYQVRAAEEVLVVDNGSTDHTREVVDSFCDRLAISYHFLQDASIPNARNMVIEKANHEIIAFTDDDCVVEEMWLESIERGFLRADNVGMVGGWVKHRQAREESMIDVYYSLFHHNKS